MHTAQLPAYLPAYFHIHHLHRQQLSILRNQRVKEIARVAFKEYDKSCMFAWVIRSAVTLSSNVYSMYAHASDRCNQINGFAWPEDKNILDTFNQRTELPHHKWNAWNGIVGKEKLLYCELKTNRECSALTNRYCRRFDGKMMKFPANGVSTSHTCTHREKMYCVKIYIYVLFLLLHEWINHESY